VHTHTGVTKENGDKQFQNVYAFNEHNLNRTNWRINIDNSVITCLNKEISDNSFKVSRWVVQALLADVDLMKFAFVSRREMNDNKKHVVLATHTV
jgi:translation initiation factor 3 subunit D